MNPHLNASVHLRNKMPVLPDAGTRRCSAPTTAPFEDARSLPRRIGLAIGLAGLAVWMLPIALLAGIVKLITCLAPATDHSAFLRQAPKSAVPVPPGCRSRRRLPATGRTSRSRSVARLSSYRAPAN